MKYYLLTINGDFNDGCNIDDYELGKFDLCRFWEYGNLTGNDLFNLSVDISSGEVSDYLSPPISLPLVSEKLKNYIEKWNHNLFFTDFQPAIRKSGVNCKYFLVESEETYSMSQGIETGLDIFRYADSDNVAGDILFTEYAAKSMKDLGFKGIVFLTNW